jgi:hypothetical protein
MRTPKAKTVPRWRAQSVSGFLHTLRFQRTVLSAALGKRPTMKWHCCLKAVNDKLSSPFYNETPLKPTDPLPWRETSASVTNLRRAHNRICCQP